MRFFTTFSSIIAVATAVAVPSDVELEWIKDKATGHTMLSIFNPKDHVLIASSCGSKLNAHVPIDFSNVDDNGSGSFTVGGKSFVVHSEVENGPVCTKKYNGDATVVDCSGFKWDNKGLHIARGIDCPSAHMQTHFMRQPHARRSVEAKQESPQPRNPIENAIDVAARQAVPCPSQGSRIDLVGDGDPHQNYWNEQLSEVQTCSQTSGCSVGQAQSYTVSVSFSVSAAATKTWGFIDFGFGVSESWGTVSSYTCNGNPSEKICIWHNTAHTACKFLQLKSHLYVRELIFMS